MTSKDHTTSVASKPRKAAARKIVPALPIIGPNPAHRRDNKVASSTSVAKKTPLAPSSASIAPGDSASITSPPLKDISNGPNAISAVSSISTSDVPVPKQPAGIASSDPVATSKIAVSALLSENKQDPASQPVKQQPRYSHQPRQHSPDPVVQDDPPSPEKESANPTPKATTTSIISTGTTAAATSTAAKAQINGSSANFAPSSQRNDVSAYPYMQPGGPRVPFYAPRPRPPQVDLHFRHYNHHSTGSFQYPFRDSNTSSPGPQSTAFPPPGMPVNHNGIAGPDARRGGGGGAGVGANGYRPMPPVPFNGDYVQMDSYGRPINGINGYPAEMHNGPSNGFTHGPPSTPHSFHDSQSSGHGEENMANYPIYNQHPPHISGQNMIDDGRHQHQHQHQHHMSADMPHMMPPFMGPRHGLVGQHHHHLHNSHMGPPGPPNFGSAILPMLSHIKNQFNVDTFADCILEIRHGGPSPLRVPAHRLVLSQSNALRQVMLSSSSTPPQGESLPHVVLHVNSRFARSDAFIFALQYLYGYDLFAIPEPMPVGDGLTMAGNALDRFNFSLGYSIAGRILELPEVAARGARMALQFLAWETIEGALEFSLGDIPNRGLINVETPMDAASKTLVRGVIDFLIDNFPANFELDSSVADPLEYRRMPMSVPPGMAVPTSPLATLNMSATSKKEPRFSILRHHRGEKRLSNVSHIQFGDLTSTPEPTLEDKETPNTTPTTEPFAHFKVLSRVLINLPFDILKETLENDLQGGVNGWRNNTARSIVAKQIIDERERRRLSLQSAVIVGKAAGAEVSVILPRLQRYEPQALNAWDILCWKEYLEESTTKTNLLKKWVPVENTEKTPAGPRQTDFGLYP
ncbi:hypothetical protein HOO65_020362 [Ceratocystis lukuohia]|uniref:BTB domain-containing protein n=1 Tax=Ceratocystis lukuohia TaxID=2019550 RepID=A0ABR4MNK5_9PEZI